MNENDYDRLIHHPRNADFKEIEHCCDAPDIDQDKLVCRNCGSVVDRVMRSTSERAYTQEEIENRKRDAPRWREFGARTTVGKKGAKTDSKGNLLKSHKKSMFNRLGKIQNSLVSSIERNFWDAKPQMKAACSKLNIPKYIQETAWRIYQRCAKKKLTMGRSIAGFIGGSLYVSIRVHEFPRLLDEVSETMMIPRKVVHQSMGHIIQEVLPNMGLKYKPITPMQLVYRYGNDLHLSLQVQRMGVNLFTRALSNGYNSIGKDPRGVASALLYIAAKINGDGERKTQKEICDTSGVTEVTLRSRIKDLKEKIHS